MHAPSSSFFASPDPAPLQASMPGRAPSQAPPPDHCPRNVWIRLVRWFQHNSFAPRWMPTRLRHPLLGYLAAALIELVAAAGVLAFVDLFPDFVFVGALAFLGIIALALGWGAGPSLCATLVGGVLLYYVILPPQFSWRLSAPADVLGLTVYGVVGFSISLFASRSERARRYAEERNQLLAQAEARSAADYQRLRTVLEVLPSAVAIANQAGRLVEVNPALRTIWGEQMPLAEDWTQYDLYKGWRVSTGQRVSAEEWGLARALTRGEVSLNEEVEIETFAGQRKTILNSTAPIRDKTGAIIGAVASEQDISEVRRLEQEVSNRAAVLETIFETMTDGIALIDARGMLVQTNQAYCTLFGVEAHPAFATLPLLERLAALDVRNEQGQPLSTETLPPLRLLQGETVQAVDLRVKSLEGREVAFNVSGAPIRDATGHITGGIEVFRDMTERHRLERRTREALSALVAMGEALVQVHQTADPSAVASEAPLQVVADVALTAVAKRLAELTQSVLGCRRVSMAAIDPSTRLLRPITVVGLPPDLEQQWWASWAPPRHLEERVDARIAAALGAGELVLLDTRHLPEHSWYLLSQAQHGVLMPMRIGGELVGNLFIDYGEQEHEEISSEERRLIGAIARLGALVLERDRLLRRWAEAHANELVLRATKEQMDTFLGMASHELKSPLTAIKLSLQITERHLRVSAGKQAETDAGKALATARFKEHLALTMKQVKRLERLINDLVDVSRVQAGKLKLRPERTDLAAIIREAVEEQRQAAPERTIALEVPEELCVPVYVDPGRVEQVVTNYLTNALKYSLADRPIAVGMRVEPQEVRVWVRDEGPGLPAEEQERIWERFHRVKGIEVQSGTEIGLGLGLHICRSIIEQHHGRVGVESTPGKGSTFWFTVPVGRPSHTDQ